MNTNSIPYLDQVLRFNEQLLGLPALPLVFAGCLAFGYALKAMPFVSNRFIPLWVILGGILGNITLALGTMTGSGLAIAAAIGRQAILGLIVAAAAWLVHNKFLKKYETTGNTETFANPEAKPTTDKHIE